MDRSNSRDLDDSENESIEDNGPGKPGRKRNPNSQAARRDQNRIAQREFRLRKQQRIRDLEAKVEILSGGKDEALGEMRNMLKDLMTENQTLRSLLRSLASFIGDGAGGVLPKLGWQMSDFNEFLNKAETDTAWEGYQKRKKSRESGASSSGQKRQSEDDIGASISKKVRTDNQETDAFNSMLLPIQSPITGPPMYSSARVPDGNAMFSNNNQGIFVQPNPTATNAPYNGATYSSSYIPGVMNNMENAALPPVSTFSNNAANNNPSSAASTPAQKPTPSSDQLDDDDDPNKVEAYKLIHYHLDNYKRNSAYCLPSSLRPTLVQRTVPHEGVIDRILHPELRDRMILLRGRFDLVDCLLEYRNSVTIHGDDVLAHVNWEIGEKWLKTYGFLVDPATLAIMNRWRKERGESELRMLDLNMQQD